MNLYQTILRHFSVATKLFLLTVIVNGSLQAQTSSVDLSFNATPDKNSTSAANFILQPDNKIIVFGDFQVVNGDISNRIARLNTNGSLDNTFNCTTCDFTITSAVLQPDGKIIIAGGLASQSQIYRLNADGSRDPSFTSPFPTVVFPESNSADVRAVQPDGKILVVLTRRFPNSYNYQLYRLNPNGTVDSTFTTITVAIGSGGIFGQSPGKISLLPDGKILAATNSFANCPGCTPGTASLKRYNADGTVDTTFESPSATISNGTNSGALINDFDVQADGGLIIVGRFTGVNGVNRLNVAKLLPAGNIDLSFNSSNIGEATRVKFLRDGRVLISTSNQFYRLNADGSPDNSFSSPTNLTQINSWMPDSAGRIFLYGVILENGAGVNKFARLSQNGSIESSFTANFGVVSSITAIAVQADGKIVFAGDFIRVNGVPRVSIARVNADGSLDTTFNSGSGFNGRVLKILVQSDGKILVGGNISSYNGTLLQSLARLNADGSLDTNFNPNISSNTAATVNTIALQSDGKIFIGGNFSSAGGQTRSGLARLNADGSLDTSFNPTFGSASINSVVVQTDGKILVGGSFNGVNGFNRTNLVRLNIDGSLDNSFNAGNIAVVRQIESQTDGRYLVLTNTIFRLNSTGATDSTFASPTFPSSEDTVYQFLVLTDGSILVGGSFSSINNTLRSNFVRLEPNGTLDSVFFPSGASGAVRTIIRQSDGRILVGGDFSAIENITRAGVARLIVNETQACIYTLSTNSITINSTGGTGSFNVISGPGCTWTAASNAPWVTVTSGGSGAGNGTVSFSVQANSGAARTGTITAGGQTFTVNQASGCSYSLSATSANFGETGGNGNVNVITEAGCTWTAASNATWITVTAGGSGTGSGPVAFSVAANTGSTRTGTITIAGQTFTVTQTSGCSYTLTPTNANIPGNASTGTFNVASGAGCSYTAVSNNSFITITSGASGSGNGVVAYSAAANVTGISRTGTITAGGQTFTITQAALPTLTINNVMLNEGNSGAMAFTFTASLSAASNQTVSVNFATANATATAGEDYTATSGTLTFAPGEVNKTLTVQVNGDTLVEPNETFTVNLSNANNAVIAIGEGTGTILNDDTGGSLQFSASNYTVNENQATATITVTRTGGNASGVSINYLTSNGTAMAGLDYLAASGTLFFAADETTRTFSIPIINDLIDEPNETVNITLSNPGGGGTLGSPVTAVLTIIDDDDAPTLSINNVSLDEGNTGTTPFIFTVSLSGASSQTVTVNFATANGTATAPSDYQFASGSLSFAPGETTKTITVLVNGDTEVEFNETFAVNLSGVANATITNGQGTGTILSEETCEFSISPTNVNIPVIGSSDNIIFLTTETGCQWDAVSSDSWITITRGNSGTGSGTITFSVAANTGPTRTGTIAIAGQTFTVTQASGCTYALSSNGTSLSAAAGSGSFNVIANTGCVWTATSNSPWLRIISNPNGNGNDEVFFSVQANAGDARTGTISVNELTFTVTQATGCSFSILPTNLEFGASAETGNFSINTGAGCTWAAVSNASWITITAGGSGTGNGTVAFSIAANTGRARAGTITIAGQTFTITQTSGCSFSIFPANLEVETSAGTGNFNISTGAGCTWAAVSNASWITITTGSNGSGNGIITFSWTANTGSTRTGTITAGGQTFTITQTSGVTTLVRTLFDFDGDGKADVSVFRPSIGGWYIDQSMNGFTGIAFGQTGDRIVPADYDGDGKTDVAVYRSGTWYLNRSTAGFSAVGFGTAEDIPQPADFDNDGKAELAVFRPSNGTWYVLNLVTNEFSFVQFGQNGDKPVVADYDGDGQADYAVYRNGGWYILRSSQGFIGIQFGEAADRPVPADYDGDGRADVAVFRPSNGTWYLNRSQAGFTGMQFGITTDIPAPADYDGDGQADIAVFRDGAWYLQRSTDGFTGVAFGAPNDRPVPSAFVP